MKSPINWVGGKSTMLNKLLPIFPKHHCYVEVFGGAGWVLFGKEPSKVEVLNDFDGLLINMWKQIKNNKDYFINSFAFTLVSREIFDDYKLKWKNNDYKDELEKAHIFFYLVNASFASDMKNPIFGTKSQRRNTLRLDEIEKTINQAYERLLKVTVENRSFEQLFKTYNNENTFFYCDPPYRNTKEYATGKFTDEQYRALKDCCESTKGNILITINDDEYIRELFKDFYIMDNEAYYKVCKDVDGRGKFKELIITNYKIN